jgi:hypothetical protein
MTVVGQLGFVARVAPETLERLSGGEPPSAGLLGLAEALVASPPWPSMGAAAVAIRHEPEPVLAVLGRLSAAAAARLDALEWQLWQARQRPPRYVSYRTAEQASQVLADRLRDRVGREILQRSTFRAVPRGGHLVLGMLAYTLDLRAEQLTERHEPGSPIVVVDDCALSGARLRTFLRDVPDDSPIIVATLYAAVELREAIEASEPRVQACLAAHDLRDLAPEIYGHGYPAWRERWTARNPDDYWTGHPEPVCFAWNEPDVNVFNPVTGAAEAGWRLVPPQRCLKNAAGSEATAEVQVCSAAPGTIGPRDSVVWAELDGGLVVASADDGRALWLTDVAAEMWRTLAATGEMEAAADVLVARYTVERPHLVADLEGFVAALVEGGLVQRPSS